MIEQEVKIVADPVEHRITHLEDERPPSCPRCHKRLVILATQSVVSTFGVTRTQLWGCPRGHATSQRRNGSFSAVEMLPDLAG